MKLNMKSSIAITTKLIKTQLKYTKLSVDDKILGIEVTEDAEKNEFNISVLLEDNITRKGYAELDNLVYRRDFDPYTSETRPTRLPVVYPIEMYEKGYHDKKIKENNFTFRFGFEPYSGAQVIKDQVARCETIEDFKAIFAFS